MSTEVVRHIQVPQDELEELQAALRFLSFARSLEENGAALIIAVNWLTQIGKRIAIHV